MKRAKIFIMWVWCWCLYGLGHCTSRLLIPLSADFFYPVYNSLMCKSFDINEKYKFKVWGE